MGYQAPGVKMLKFRGSAGSRALPPPWTTPATARTPSPGRSDYTAGEPAGPIKEYLDWILSPAGQKIVETRIRASDVTRK